VLQNEHRTPNLLCLASKVTCEGCDRDSSVRAVVILAPLSLKLSAIKKHVPSVALDGICGDTGKKRRDPHMHVIRSHVCWLQQATQACDPAISSHPTFVSHNARTAHIIWDTLHQCWMWDAHAYIH
jgi:hypothetical protein